MIATGAGPLSVGNAPNGGTCRHGYGMGYTNWGKIAPLTAGCASLPLPCNPCRLYTAGWQADGARAVSSICASHDLSSSMHHQSFPYRSQKAVQGARWSGQMNKDVDDECADCPRPCRDGGGGRSADAGPRRDAQHILSHLAQQLLHDGRHHHDCTTQQLLSQTSKYIQ